MKYNAYWFAHHPFRAVESHFSGGLKSLAAKRGTILFAKMSCTAVLVHISVPAVKFRCMLAPPYVAMKCSVMSDKGQPSVSPLTMGFTIPEMPLIWVSKRSEERRVGQECGSRSWA